MNDEINKNYDKNQNSKSSIINEKDIINKKENSSFFDSSNSYSKKSQISLSKRKKRKRKLTIEIKQNPINRDLKNHHSYLKYFADKLFGNEEHLNKQNLLYKKKSSSNQNLNHFLQIGKKKLEKIKIAAKINKNYYEKFFKLELKEKNPKKQTIFNILKAIERKNNDSPNNSKKNSSLINHNVNNIFNKYETLKINEKIKSNEVNGKKGKEEIGEKKEDIITKKEINGERENEINIFKEKQIQKKENKRKITCYPLKSLCCLCYK